MLVTFDLKETVPAGTILYFDNKGKVTLQKTKFRAGYACGGRNGYMNYVPCAIRKARGLHFTSNTKRIEKFKQHILKEKLYVPGWSMKNWILHQEVIYIGLYWVRAEYIGACVIIGGNISWANIGIFVKREHRKMGVATALYKNALAWAIKNGVELRTDGHIMYDKLDKKFKDKLLTRYQTVV